jgi:hypothetical protein
MVFVIWAIGMNTPIAIGQQVFDIKADYFSTEAINPPTFYLKSKKFGYWTMEYSLVEMDSFEYGFLLNSYNEVEQPDDALKDVSNIKNMGPKELGDALKHQKFYFKESGDYIDVLELYNDAYFTLSTYKHYQEYDYEKNEYYYEWRLSNIYFYTYVYVRLNQQKTMVVLYDKEKDDEEIDFMGWVVPFADSNMVILDDKQFFKDKPIKEELDFQDIYGYAYKSGYDDKRLKSVQHLFRIENNRLKDALFNKDVMPQQKFDTLYFEKGFVVGKSEGYYKLFNARLDEIAAGKKVKAYYFLDTYIQTIVNNSYLWFNDNGKHHKEGKPKMRYYTGCGQVAYVNRGINKVGSDCFLIEKSHSTWKQDTTTNIYPLFTALEYDDVCFLDGNKSYDYISDFRPWASIKLDYNLLITKKGAHFGLVKMELDTAKSRVEAILPIEYDSIALTGYNSPLKVKKGKLYGYYPLNASVRYKYLSNFNHYFARFTLPNGKRGWLSIDGKETFD